MAEKNFLEGETGLKIIQTGVGEVGALASLFLPPFNSLSVSLLRRCTQTFSFLLTSAGIGRRVNCFAYWASHFLVRVYCLVMLEPH